MGNVSGVYTSYFGSPDTSPNVNAPPTFDSQYGFPYGRKARRKLAFGMIADSAYSPATPTLGSGTA